MTTTSKSAFQALNKSMKLRTVAGVVHTSRPFIVNEKTTVHMVNDTVAGVLNNVLRLRREGKFTTDVIAQAPKGSVTPISSPK